MIEQSKKTSKLSFTDAAEVVLVNYANQKPMHYKALWKKIASLELVQTKGATPEATFYAQVPTEIKRRTLRGDARRFVMQPGGLISLAKWDIDEGVAALIKKHNDEVRQELPARLITRGLPLRPVRCTSRAAWSNRDTPLQPANLLDCCLGLMMDSVKQVWHTPRILSQCTPKRRNGQLHSKQDLLNLIDVCAPTVRRRTKDFGFLSLLPVPVVAVLRALLYVAHRPCQSTPWRNA